MARALFPLIFRIMPLLPGRLSIIYFLNLSFMLDLYLIR